MDKPIRILHVVSELNQGGIENFIMNIYRKIDKDKIQFDFIVHHSSRGFFEDEIESLGGKIYHFSFFDDKNIFKYKKNLRKFFYEHKEYKIIHGHLASIGFIYLSAAKKAGIKYRIAHSHGTSTPKSLKGFVKSIIFKFFKYSANIKFACSTEAGLYMFKKKNSFKVIPNAIDFDRFKFNTDIRNKYRKKYLVGEDFLIGHVGRFTIEKNHEFILEIFNRLISKNKKYKLILIGDGPLKTKIESKVKDLGLDNYVIFTGNIKDVENMYNMMDIFILPSLFEGLPVTGIESQVSGLPSLFSDKITQEVSISGLSKFLSIDDPDIWVDSLLEMNCNNDRNKVVIKNNSFNINNLVKYLVDFYINSYMKGDVDEKKIDF